MNRIVIVIPTYWTWGSNRAHRPVEAIFDHPTPVDGESTLPRLLNSLCGVVGPSFAVWVLTATVHPALDQIAQQRMTAIITPYRERFPIAQFAANDLAVFHAHLRAWDQGELVPLFSLRSYPGVRNCQLAISHALGADVVVALDDDEVVDSDYLSVVCHHIGRKDEGGRVLGLAGLYLNADGDILLPELGPTGCIFLDKSVIMNEGTRALLGTPGRLVDTPVAFGGNMVFHHDLFSRVGFDPGIARGEDIDYVINARLAGFRFWLDKELSVTHLPPEAHDTHPYARLVQDVRRFVYEREKSLLAGLDPAELDPYPGRFLREDVAEQGLVALKTLATPETVRRFGSPEEVVVIAERNARDTSIRYLELAARWPGLMETIGQDAGLGEWLQACFDRPASAVPVSTVWR